MFHKIQKVEVKDDYVLIAIFNDGTKKKYDMKPLMNKNDIFDDLKYNNLFKMAYVDQGGYGIVWNDDIDLSSEDIWENGVEI